MINTVLFDFDGTLINTNDVIVAAWQHTYRKYLGHEMPLEHITRCFGEPLLLTMAREFPAVPPEESAEVYRTHQREMADELVRLLNEANVNTDEESMSAFHDYLVDQAICKGLYAVMRTSAAQDGILEITSAGGGQVLPNAIVFAADYESVG